MDRKRTVVGPMKDRVKSRISPINHRLWTVIAPMLLVLCTLFGVNEMAWGYAASKLTVKVSGQGQVAVTTSSTQPGSSSYSSTPASDDQSDLGILSTHTYYVWVKPNEGYRCTGVSDCSWNDAGYYTISITGRTSQVKKEVTATFVGNSYTISFAGNSNTSGTMSGQSGFVYGTPKTLSTNTFGRAYTVTYDANGGSCGTSSATATYTFNGWKSSDGTSYADKASVSTFSPTPAHGATVTLTAQWTSASVTLPSATKDGAVLEGWYVGSIAEGNKITTATYTPTANVKLVANWINKYDFEITGDDYTINNEAWNKTEAFNFVHADENHMTTTIEKTDVISYDRAKNTITALKIGTSKITFTQNTSTTVNNGTIEYTITVDSVANTLTASPSYTCYVDTANFANIISNKNSNATVTTTSTAASIAYYNVSENKIYVPNSEAKSFTDTTVTIHIKQAATGKYKAVDKAITLTVKKRLNTLYANGSDNYSVDMYVDRTQNVTLTAMNTDYSGSPISVEQINAADSAIAKYVYSQASHSGTVTSRQFINSSTKWRFTQPENYKYLAGCDTFTVVVKKLAEATDCYVLDDENTYNWGTYGEKEYNFTERGVKLFYEIQRTAILGFTDNVAWNLYYYDAQGNELKKISLSVSNKDKWYSFTEDTYFSDKVRSVKFASEGGAAGNHFVRNVKVTRETWLNVGTDNSAINGTLTINKKADGVSAIYPGEKGQKSTTVYWSIANGGNLKIKCDDPRFSFSQSTITGVDCNSGTTAITVYYSDTVVGTATATATVYNDVYNQTFTVKGIIEKAKQPVTWNYNVVRYNDTITDAVSATVSPVTYESANPNIIKVIKDNLNQNTILVAVDTGTVNITAHVPGNAYYAAVDTVHAIKVTMKQLQTIVWNQSLFDLELGGDNRTLTATATSDVEGCISTRLVEYVSSDPDVVYIAPGTNVLQIKGVGTTTVTAFQRGGWDVDGHDYDSIATQKTAIVRDPNAPCESYIYQQTSEYKFDLGANALNKQTVSSTPEIDLNGMIADTCTFRYKGEQRGTFKVFNGTMKVEQYVMVGSSRQWVEAKTLAKPTEFNNHYYKDTVVFRRDATKVRFKVFDGYGNHYYTDCRIKQARFIETTTPTKFTLNVGQTQDQTIYLSYSNVVGNISFTLGQGENSSFSVNRTIITDTCGGHAKNVAVVITYNPQHEVQNEQDVLTISDGTTSCEVILKGSATRVGRTITWNHTDVRSIYTVEKDTLIAEARTSLNALAGTVEFTYVNNTSTANGSIDANNILSFTSAGTAYVVANTPNHDYYFPAATVGPKRWDVALTPTEVVEVPTIGSVVSGTALSDITVSGGTARDIINHGSVSGTFTVQNGNVTDVGPNNPVTVKFTPEDGTMYDMCTYNMYIEVTQRPATDEEIGTVTAGHITFGEKLSDAVLSMSGTLNGHGTLVMTDPQKDEVKDVDTYENLKVLFTPGNTNIAPKELTVSVTVDKANPAVTPQATDITYGQPISASNITTASGDVAGSWAWAVDDTQVLSVGDHVLKANFTSDSANYNNLSNVDVTLKVKKIEKLEVEVPLSFCAGGSETFHGETYTTAGTDQINAVGATRDTIYNVTVTVLQPTTGTDSKTITVGDNESWHEIDLSGYAVGSHEVEYHTTNVAGCDSTVTLSLTVNAVVPVGPNTFTGNGEWENPSNWSTGIVPTTAEPDIIVVGQLVINEEKTIGGLTIMPTGGVTIVDDGKLTVNGTTTTQTGGYGDLYVANGGEVEVAGSLTVRDLIVEASIGTSEGNAESGQVASAENIVYTNAYIDINMDPSGVLDDTKWYGFTIPFAVDAYNGVSRLEGSTFQQCGYGVHYMIAEYDANKRLNTGNGWKFIGGNTLNAGQFYLFTVEGSYNTYRFKASGSSYTPAAAASLNVNGPTTNYDANWNGVGNSTLQHVTASYYGGEYVQVFMNGQDAYKTVSTNDANFVVGCPFFIQAKEATTLLLSGENTLVDKYYAPRRMQAEATAVSRINLSATDGGYSDQIYFSAVDKEQDAYIIGQDLSKAGESKVVPQLWMAQYNQKLSVHEAAWNGDQATCPLGIYVPKSGEFVLTATQPEDGTQIYLTENGAPIWDLTMSEYVLSLEKGNTSSYGLMIVRAPQVTTGVEDVQGAGAEVRKVIIDNTMYIITPEGTMFNVIGKKVQ